MAKRVLCVLSSMNAGGAETFLMKVYRTIDKSQYQMDFCIGDADKCFYEKEIKRLGGVIFSITPKTVNLSAFSKELKSIITTNQYKYVLRVGANGLCYLDLKIAKRAGAIRCVARSSNSSSGDSIKNKIFHKIGCFLYKKYIDVAIAPSDLSAIYSFGKKQYNKGDVNILRNGVDVDYYSFNKTKRDTICHEFELDNNDFVVGHVGRFMTQKNHTFLLDIFSEICKKNPCARLLLVGTGELEDDIRQKADSLGLTDKIIFAGLRSDVPALLSAMDVMLFPSLYEGMPNVIIESQASGLPCVISDTITKEADITGLVEYVSLEESAEYWADRVLDKQGIGRKSYAAEFKQAGYDIKDVANKFTELIFGKE